MINRISLVVSFCLLIAVNASAEEKLSKDQIAALFSQANDAFRRANTILNDTGKAADLYEKSILGYEKIIQDGCIRNPKLYYNLANAYLLRNDVGRAILNYRRAEKLDRSDSNIRKNLAFARGRRVDKVELKTEERILQTLAFWHYDFSIRTKFAVACICLGVFCLTSAVIIWLGRRASLTVLTVVSVILFACLFGSVVVESFNNATNLSGVIIAPEVVAYQGDGQNYPPSFKQPLHAGTEFDLIERRTGWFHIKLADGSDGWIPQTSAEVI
jgi:tetratricopeptide (TPR) repeat protein